MKRGSWRIRETAVDQQWRWTGLSFGTEKQVMIVVADVAVAVRKKVKQ